MEDHFSWGHQTASFQAYQLCIGHGINDFLYHGQWQIVSRCICINFVNISVLKFLIFKNIFLVIEWNKRLIFQYSEVLYPNNSIECRKYFNNVFFVRNKAWTVDTSSTQRTKTYIYVSRRPQNGQLKLEWHLSSHSKKTI